MHERMNEAFRKSAEEIVSEMVGKPLTHELLRALYEVGYLDGELAEQEASMERLDRVISKVA